MEFPDKCLICGASYEELPPKGGYLIKRAELDFDRDKPDRIEDEIHECSECHSLYRFRWKLVSIKHLKEVEIRKIEEFFDK